MYFGIHLTLLIGPTVAVPAPPFVVEALQSAEVSFDDDGQSACQLTFQVGRGGPLDALESPLLSTPLLNAFNRVILIVTLNVTPRVLFDGIITDWQYSPSNQPGRSTLTLTVEDVSVVMDREEKSAEHPAQDETIIALKIIASYAQYGMIPFVIPPLAIDPPLPIERIPVQQGTDLQFLRQLAARHAYVFYVTPGPAPFTNTAYWGPPIRLGVPQRALSVNLGAETNVDRIDYRFKSLEPTTVSGRVQDRTTNATLPVQTFASLRPPLAAFPAWLVNLPNLRRTQLRASGLNAPQAFARAQAMTDRSVDAVEANGQLDALRYGALLSPRALVGVRGAGYAHDGFWYVKRVTHSIRKESYKQGFVLTREGLGSTTPVVVP